MSAPAPRTISLQARWVFPVAAAPIERGVVEIFEGRITAIHDRSGPETNDLGDVALIPGLVNCHTHLEFSTLGTPLRPQTPFADWIRKVIQARRSRPALPDPIAAGLSECLATGTTALGEIATADWPADVGKPIPQSVIFRELIGLSESVVESQREVARRHLSAQQGGGGCQTAGLSPHAPYSVHPRLLEGAIDLACEFGVPVAMHVAETNDELELLERGKGPLVEMLRGMSLWNGPLYPPGTRPLDILKRLARAPRALVIHGNGLDESECRFLADQSQMTVIHCPRTHAAFEHAVNPLEALLEAGVRVAIGTDSRASNPDLSLWQELKLLAERRGLDRGRILELGTLAGARALGLEHSQGVLMPGQPANLAAVRLSGSSSKNPCDLLFAEGSHIVGVMREGHWARGNVGFSATAAQP